MWYQLGNTRNLRHVKVFFDPAKNRATAQEVIVGYVLEDDSNGRTHVYDPPIVGDTTTFPLRWQSAREGRSDYKAKIYLNGRLVHERRHPTIFQPEGDKVTGIQLKAGLNVLEFGVVRANLHGWGGSVWITEADGQAVKGIKVTLDPDAVR